MYSSGFRYLPLAALLLGGCGESSSEAPAPDLDSVVEMPSTSGTGGSSPADIGGQGGALLPVGGGGSDGTGGNGPDAGGSSTNAGGNAAGGAQPDPFVDLMVACDPAAEGMPELADILSLKAEPKRGQFEYLNACSFCHAATGMGMTLDSGVNVPPIKGIPWTCEQVLKFRDGVPDTPMISFAETNDEQWLANMIAYIQLSL